MFQLSPLLPSFLIVLILAPIAVFIILGLFMRRRGSTLRSLAFLGLTLALLNPSFIEETRENLPSTVAIVLDNSQSQNLGERKADSAAAAKKLQEMISSQPGLEARLITVAQNHDNTPQTRAFSALREGLSDLPPARLSGVILITDGQVHDIPLSQEILGVNLPVNALITGRPNEFDRKAVFIEPPRFGIVKQPIKLKVLIENQGKLETKEKVRAEIKVNGEVDQTLMIEPGIEKDVEITLPRAGDNIIELSTPAVNGEITTQNNQTVITVNGIQQNLRVLLVSGEPHNGERVWRDLLKSDTSVDLIHFTILRLPERSDNTPENELSLISFPITELFVNRINDFDLMIFDRYQNYDVMARVYYDFMAEYVKNGGALLVATGPEFAGEASLAYTALSDVIPVKPTGEIIQKPFQPHLTKEGERHPVTRGLTSGTEWGRWMRQIDIAPPTNETVLMAGADEKPLMLLSRVEKGRVGVLLSDQGWLWARGFESGGPYAMLYRRMAHWLMKEPELEEEALTATSKANTLFIERQTMSDTPSVVKVTSPAGKEFKVILEKKQEGVFKGKIESDEVGFFTVEQDDKRTLAYLGPIHAPEYDDMISTPDKLKEISTLSGGNVIRLHQTKDGASIVPNLVQTKNSKRSDILIVRPPTESRLVESRLTPLFSGLIALTALLLLLIGTWYREGK